MIHESRYWKDDLLRTARRLEARRVQRNWPEASFARTEQAVMLGFYSIRRLIESHKLSEATVTLEIPLLEYGRGLSRMTVVNWPMLKAHYDLEHASPAKRDVLFVCHQIIHSYVFSVAVGERGGFRGVFFSSDRKRNIRLHYIAATEIIRTFQTVGKDYPDDFEAVWDERINDYRVRTGIKSKPS